MKLDFNDLLIVPKEISDINSRSEVDPYRMGYLPLMTAPMDTVVCENNAMIYEKNRIAVCLPRNTFTHLGFKSYSINQIKEKIADNSLSSDSYLIDVANGHMDSVYALTKFLKKENPFIRLMVGNVANPKTFELLSKAGADYIRVGIGNGGACLTTQNTGVGYPMASLIKECYEVAQDMKKPAYIVADGGMQNYSDIIKALGLGADYVMVGSLFNKSLESSGENLLWKKIKVSNEIAELAYRYNIPIYKKFRGMSTKEVQKKWGAKVLKTSEGVVRLRKVEYKLEKWVKNFEDYLRSAMSYSGAHNLNEFIGKAKFVEISDKSYKRFNK